MQMQLLAIHTLRKTHTLTNTDTAACLTHIHRYTESESELFLLPSRFTPTRNLLWHIGADIKQGWEGYFKNVIGYRSLVALFTM